MTDCNHSEFQEVCLICSPTTTTEPAMTNPESKREAVELKLRNALRDAINTGGGVRFNTEETTVIHQIMREHAQHQAGSISKECAEEMIHSWDAMANDSVMTPAVRLIFARCSSRLKAALKDNK